MGSSVSTNETAKSYFDVLPPGALGSNLIICRQNPPTPEAQGLLVKHSKMVAA